jgi:hypothetical protein
LISRNKPGDPIKPGSMEVLVAVSNLGPGDTVYHAALFCADPSFSFVTPHSVTQLQDQ